MARGGKRDGAGRPTGSRWKPATKAFRQDAVEKMTSIVNQSDDPLTIVAGWIADPTLEMSFRLSAANTALPFLYPRLSASSVDACLTVEKIDTAALLSRLDDRIAKLGQPTTIDAQPEVPPLAIEVVPDEDD